MKAWSLDKSYVTRDFLGSPEFVIKRYLENGRVVRVSITEIKPRKRKGKI